MRRSCRRVNVGSNPETPRLPPNSELPIPGLPRYTPAIVPRTLPAATPRHPAPLVGVLVVLLLVTVLACPQSTAAPGLPASATAIDARGSDPPPAFPTLHRTTHSSVSAFQPFSFSSDLSHTRGGAGVIGGLLAIVEEDGRTLLPVHDGHGNITAVVNAANGHTVARYDYGPFGELIGQSGDVGASPFRYQSKYLDPEKCDRIRSILDGGGAGARRVRHAMPRMSNQTGLHYFGHRYYSSHRGRWISRDPAGEAGGWNLYAYCENDPAGRIDLHGLTSWRVVPGSVELAVTPEGRILGTVRIRRIRNQYRGEIEEMSLPVARDIQLEARLFGGAWDGLTLEQLEGAVEESILARAQAMLASERQDQLVRSLDLAQAGLMILPGWQSGDAVNQSRHGAAAGYFGRDLATFFVGGTLVRGVTHGRRALAAARAGGASGLIYTTGTIATERLEAAFTGQAYHSTWGDDAMHIGLGMAFGGGGGYAVGRWFGGGGTIGSSPGLGASGRGRALVSEYRRFRGQGYSAAQARYLTQPYTKTGQHFFYQNYVDDLIGRVGAGSLRGRALTRFRDSPLNLIRGRSMNIGRFYEYHARLHRKPKFGIPSSAQSWPLPRAAGGGRWRYSNVLNRPDPWGPAEYIWHGSPWQLKAAVGGSGALGAWGIWRLGD